MFLLTFLHILGLMRQVVEGVDQVKDITEKTNRKLEEGVNETEGKDISITFLFEEIHWVNDQQNPDHVADLASELVTESSIGFWI